VYFVQILEKGHDKLDPRAIQCVFRIFSDTKKILETCLYEVCDLCDCHFLWEHTLLFSLYGFYYKTLTTPVTLSVQLEDSSPLQVYQKRKKITTHLDSLLPHQSTAFTEVSELSKLFEKVLVLALSIL